MPEVPRHQGRAAVQRLCGPDGEEELSGGVGVLTSLFTAMKSTDPCWDTPVDALRAVRPSYLRSVAGNPRQRMKGHGKDRLEKATYQPGEYGRMVRRDGTEQWWVRSSIGTWVALRHERVMPNDDGSITLLLMKT